MRVRKEVLAVVGGGVVEMERAESLRHGGMGGGWGGGQEGNKQPCESTSSVHKGRAFTKVSPEALSCHEARKGN